MSRLALIGLFGIIGGAASTWFWYAKLPIPGYGDHVGWSVVPAGAIHGGLLAVFSVGVAATLWESRRLIRWLGLPLAGFLSSWFSVIPLQIYNTGPSLGEIAWAFVWPIQVLFGGLVFGMPLSGLVIPFVWFGFAGSFYYFLLNICRQLTSDRLVIHLLMGSLTGWVSSLCWFAWAEMEFSPWHVHVLHGAIWGSLVGFGVWKSQQGPVKPVEKVHHL